MLLITKGQLGLMSHPGDVSAYRQALDWAVERAKKHARTMYVVYNQFGVTGYDIVLYDGSFLVSSINLQRTNYCERDVVAVVRADGSVNAMDNDGRVLQHL